MSPAHRIRSPRVSERPYITNSLFEMGVYESLRHCVTCTLSSSDCTSPGFLQQGPTAVPARWRLASPPKPHPAAPPGRTPAPPDSAWETGPLASNRRCLRCLAHRPTNPSLFPFILHQSIHPFNQPPSNTVFHLSTASRRLHNLSELPLLPFERHIRTRSNRHLASFPIRVITTNSQPCLSRTPPTTLISPAARLARRTMLVAMQGRKLFKL